MTEQETRLERIEEKSRLKELMRQRMLELEWVVMDLAKAYGCLKENRPDVNPNRYRNTVVKVLEHPDSSRFDTVRLCLMAMGYVIYAAQDVTEL